MALEQRGPGAGGDDEGFSVQGSLRSLDCPRAPSLSIKPQKLAALPDGHPSRFQQAAPR